MLYGPLDPNERFRARRDQTRRRKRRRRAAVLGFLLLVVIAVVMGARFVSAGQPEAAPTPAAVPAMATAMSPRPLPLEIRGIHVTGALASLPGKFRSYVGYKRYGLNTIELDVKDEGGEIGFQPANVPLARTVGATRPFYDPKALVALAHRNGVYMIGRVVCFQDPKLAQGRPDPAIQRRDGSVWTTSAGLGWVNPYDRRVWDYCVSVAEAAAAAGFDQIMFDYVRFPSDGDIASAVYPGKTSVPRGRVIAGFVEYARTGSSRAASASRPRSSASPRRATSASDRCRGSSRSMSTASRRCHTRSSTGAGSWGSRARATSRERRCSARSPTSAGR